MPFGGTWCSGIQRLRDLFTLSKFEDSFFVRACLGALDMQTANLAFSFFNRGAIDGPLALAVRVCVNAVSFFVDRVVCGERPGARA